MSDIQKESEGAALALPGLEALLQSYQSINAQISSLNAALQLQNGLLAQTAALAAPTFFSNLTMGLYAMQLAVDALSASYTMLLGKLANMIAVLKHKAVKSTKTFAQPFKMLYICFTLA